MTLLIPADRLGEAERLTKRVLQGESIRNFDTVRVGQKSAKCHE